MTLSDLFWLALLGLTGLLSWEMLKQRELALREVKRRCEALDLQMLDQAVALRRLRLSPIPGGGLGLCCEYAFEFASTGEERYRGRIVLLGGRPTRFELEPHRFA